MNSYILLENQLKAQAARLRDEGQGGAYPWPMGSGSERRSSTYSELSNCLTDPFSLHTDPGDLLSIYGGASVNGAGWKRTTPSLSRRTSQGSLESIDTDLDTHVEPWGGGDCLYVYLAACRHFKEVPVTAVKESLHLQQLQLTHQNLQPAATHALCLALVVNTTVTELDVSHNRLGIDGLQHVKDLMLNNSRIKTLNVSHNGIGSAGLRALAVTLQQNKTLKHLTAAGNEFGTCNKYTAEFAKSVQDNVVLESLDLGYNQIGEDSGPFWAHALGNNYGLSKLVLRWNHLRWRGVQFILRSLQLNETLRVLDLAWNGVADEGAHILGGVLLYNTCLEELDLTCNRISLEGCLCICKGLLRNTTLKVLKMSKNPITTNGATSLLEMYQENEDSALTRLELLDIEVERYFETVLEEIQESGRPLEVLHGGIVMQGDVYLQNGQKKRPVLGDPLQLLFEHVKNSNLRLWDLFAQFDKDKSLSITREEFKNGMKEARLPIDDFQTERIMNALDKDRNGEITFEELLDGYKRYREKERKKYETLLPFILQRPSSSRRENVKDDNAPVPRVKANTMSMQGSVGETSQINLRKGMVLPEISVTTDADQSSLAGGSTSRTFTLLPQINLSEGSVGISAFQTTESHDQNVFNNVDAEDDSSLGDLKALKSVTSSVQSQNANSTRLPRMPVIGETSDGHKSPADVASLPVRKQEVSPMERLNRMKREPLTYMKMSDLRRVAQLRRGSLDSSGLYLSSANTTQLFKSNSSRTGENKRSGSVPEISERIEPF